MALFGDLLSSITGQVSAAPYNPVDIGGAMMTGAGQAAAANLAYNRQFAPGIFDLQLELERKYDPNIAALREATSRSIANELALGSSLSPEIQQLVTQNALQSGAASGFGLSRGGRALVARDLGLTGLDLGRQRRAEAGGYVRSSPSLNSLYAPNQSFQPAAAAEQNIALQNIENQRRAEDFYRTQGNKLALFNTFGRVAGGVAGGALGSAGGPFGALQGAQLGSNIGGSFFQNPYRAQTQGGGGLFSSILSGLGGNIPFGTPGINPLGSLFGIPQFGAGAGALYADPRGNLIESVRAAPVNIAGFETGGSGGFRIPPTSLPNYAGFYSGQFA